MAKNKIKTSQKSNKCGFLWCYVVVLAQECPHLHRSQLFAFSDRKLIRNLGYGMGSILP